MFASLFRKQFPGSTQRKTPFRKAKRDSFCCLAVESLEDRTLLSTFTVLNTSDSGPDSLRQAILDANAATGTDTIAFSIAGGGAQTIAPITALPALTGPVVIDGTTQPGFAGTPIVELSGNLLTTAGHGLRISAGNSIVRGLVVNRFTGSGIADIMLDGFGGNRIEGNYIGTAVSGAAAFPIGSGAGISLFSSSNVVGGSAAGAGNLISGNQVGININSTGNWVEGNRIGTTADGAALLGNNTGVQINAGATGNVIGGTAVGAGNVIAGHSSQGIAIAGTGNRVEGNLIGTNALGTAALGNNVGVLTSNTTGSNVIGGTAGGAGNLISGNGTGINLNGVNNLIQGNRIGTNSLGTAALPNSSGVVSFGSGNVVGGTAVGAANVVSGNTDFGVRILFASANRVEGNRIGTTPDGLAPLGNGTGVQLFSAPNNTIGGTAMGAANTIAANRSNGVDIDGAAATANVVQGNYIGTDTSGTVNLANGVHGVRLNSASNTVAGNTIASNTLAGIFVASGTGNVLTQNSIFANTALGIDLAPTGVTANDAGDVDTGSNNLQNFPVLASAKNYPGSTEVAGSLGSTPNTAFTLELFSSPVRDGTGFGEGKTYLGTASVTTDGGGNASFSAVFGTSVAVGQFVTATARDPGGNTSEFSQAIAVTAGNQPPTITSNGGGASASLFIAENTTAVTTVTASDSDIGQTLTYVISGGPDSALFTIDGLTGVLAFSTAPNFECPTDVGSNNVYDVRVQVSDGIGGLASQAISVAVTNVNEGPTSLDLSNSVVSENSPVGTAVGTLLVTDPDAGDTFTFTLVSGSGSEGNAAFSIVGDVLKTAIALNFESRANYSVLIAATDASGRGIVQNFTIAIGNLNESAPSAGGASFFLPSNAPFSFQLSASDPDLTVPTFRIANVPLHGQATVSSSGYVTYIPNVAFVGQDVFSFKANDGEFDSNLAQITLSDGTAAPQVGFTTPSQIATEDQGQVTIRARLSRTAEQVVTLPLTFEGSATSVDYTAPTDAVLTIPVGASEAILTLDLTDDHAAEGAETIVVNMGAPTNAVLGTAPGYTSHHVIGIAANDMPTVTFAKSLSHASERFTSPEGYSSNVVLEATLSYRVPYDVFVPVTYSGEAQPFLDFSLWTPLGLHFAPFALVAALEISVLDDGAVEPNENITITMGSPQGALPGATTATEVIVHDNDRARLGFETAGQTLWEDDGSATVTVTLNQPALTNVNGKVVRVDGTASVGHDVTMPAGTFTIQAGNLSASVTIPIIDDSDNESGTAETLRLAIDNISGADPYSTTSGTAFKNHTIKIKDDDPTIAFSDPLTSTPSEGAGIVYFTAELSAATNKDVTVRFSLAGSATKDADYELLKPSLQTASTVYPVTIPAGELQGKIPVRLLKDSKVEVPEILTVTMGTVANAKKVSPSSQTLTIIDDDDPGISFVGASKTVKESDRAFRVTVKLSAPASHDVDVALVRSGGTAKQFTNYLIAPTSLHIPAGETEASFSIDPLNDTSPNPDRTLIIGMKNLSNAVLGKPQTFTVTFLDDDEPVTVVKPATKPPSLPVTGPGAIAIPDVDPNETIVLGPKLSYSGTGPVFSISHGYIAGGTIFFDANKNLIVDFLDLSGDGIQDPDEPTEVSTLSSYDGLFALDVPLDFDLNGDGVIDANEGQYVVAGGIDTSTLQPLVAPMIAPVGTYSMTPLSTLAATLVNEQGYDVDAAYDRVLEALGLPNIDITTIDVLRDAAAGNPDAPELFAASTKLFNALSLVAGFVSGAETGPPASFVSNIFLSNLAAKIAVPVSYLDLSDSIVMESVIEGVLNETGVIMSREAIGGAAAVIAESNQQIDLVPNSDDGSYLSRIAQIQVVAEGTVTAQLNAFAAGTLALDELVQNNTGAALFNQINAAVIGDLLPTGIIISNVQQSEGDAGQVYFDFMVSLDRVSSQTITVNYATQDGVAEEADGDYDSTSGILTWAAGDTRSQIVRVAVSGDTRFEPGEDFFVVLTDPTHAVLRKDIGQGIIVNDDGFNYQAPADAGANALRLHVDGQYVQLFRGDERVIQGNLAVNAPFSILGAYGVENTLTIELGDQAPTGGTIAFIGAGNTNYLLVQDAAAENVIHSLIGSHAGNLVIDGLMLQYSAIELLTDGMTPALTGLPVSSVEGTEYVFGIVAPADDAPDRFSYEWLVKKNGVQFASGAGVDFRFTPDDNADYEASVTITADGRGLGTVAGTFHAGNLAPTIAADNASITVHEGHTATNTGTFGDPGSDPVVLSASIGTVTDNADGTWSWDYAPDDGPAESQIVTITATDDSGDFSTTSFELVVNNVAPVATLTNTGANEGSAALVSFVLNVAIKGGGVADPSQADIDAGFHYAFDLDNDGTFDVGDGTYAGSGTNVSALVPASLLVDGPGTHTVAGRIIDKDDGFNDYTTTIDIRNVAPRLTLDPVAAIDEDGVGALTGTITDPGILDGLTLTVNWGDPVSPNNVESYTFPASAAGNQTFSLTHQYLDNNPPGAPFEIKVAASDGEAVVDGLLAIGRLTVNGGGISRLYALDALSGAATAIGDIGIDLTDLAYDPLAGTLFALAPGGMKGGGSNLYRVDLASAAATLAGPLGVNVTALAFDAGSLYASNSAGELYVIDPNTLAVTLLCTGVDGAAGLAFDTATHTLYGGAYNGDLFTIDLATGATTLVSAGAFDLQDLAFELTTQTMYACDASGNLLSVDTTTGAATLVGPGGFAGVGLAFVPDTTTATTRVVVRNIAPTLTISSASSVDEGSTYTLTLASSDPGADTITNWSINWGDGKTQDVSGKPTTVTHVYADGSNSYTINATATDEDGTYSANSTAVAVNNVAPTLTISGASSVDEGSTYTLTLASSDPGTDTITSWSITWGDGNTENVSGNPASVTHIYADGANTYTITATASDEDGTYSANSIAVAVNGVPGDTPTLIGDNGDNVWEILGSGVVKLNNVTYTGVQNLVGGMGTDRFIFRDGQSLAGTINGGAGVNTLDYSAYTSGVTVNLSNHTASGVAALALGSIQNVIGGAANDSLIGDAQNNVIDTGEGNNTVSTDGGNDTILAGNGNNDIHSGAGNDTIMVGHAPGHGANRIHAGDGIDTITVVSDGDQDLRADGGDDTITLTGNGNNAIHAGGGNNRITVTGNGRNDIHAGNGSDVVTLVGNGNNIFHMGGGADILTITGGGNNDAHTGGDASDDDDAVDDQITITGNGNNIVHTGAANDRIIITGNGNNDIHAGSGNDVITITGNGCNHIDGGAGNDVITVSGDGNNNIDGGAGNDIITITGNGNNDVNGGAGNDTIRIIGDGANHVSGGADNDCIQVIGNGANFLEGGADNDVLIGGAGNDILDGGAGNDILVGGFGCDRLIGGTGHDVISAREIDSGTACSFAELSAISAAWAANKAEDTALDDGSDASFSTVNDTVTGGTGYDWFIVNLDDIITDFNAKQGDDKDLISGG